MKKNIKNTLLLLTLGAIVAVVGYKYTQAQQDQPIFTSDVVKRGNIEKVVLTNGVLYPSKLVSVGAQVSGLIETMDVNVGQNIKQGDLIAQIDNLTQQNALKEAQASLQSIDAQYRAKQAQIKVAQSEYARNKKMLVNGAASVSDFDSAESILAVYLAELDELSAEKDKAIISVDNAKLNLGYTTIRSPIDGTVIYVSVEEGQTVNNNQGTPSIIELAQLDVMTIKAQVSEADIINVSAGQDVYFSILGATAKKYRGVLRTIEPGPTLLSGADSSLMIGDDEAIYYNALFDVENPDNLLRFGMTAQVSIILANAQDTLLVPSQILITKTGPSASYQVPVIVDNHIEYRNVEVGINNKVYAQILSGLNEGDQIMLGQTSANDDAISMTGLSKGNMLGQSVPGLGKGKRL
ncbi:MULTISPECIES: efflux RND transporter periplasmic adaptor subunit [Shewanella]|jgi:macrolide-specific efflux system membrane fusion protein|uniref:Efflux RND transporter periplasmic adaptor subunit n=1 Tax=Shewanella psychromarinicola TaxID=2487742 RepID=A0A3N4E7Y1_9GAMM|nr:efflux RND transporter periplasmic adaptor subunit [Shewanella psychromarinicola]AZG36332.1 efflux RND transporter periplasmic adaptor subunit [Shewanella psychromarinicola]MCL1080794.1 efflux RND transporter periplasmic adaptor subunit [Shewanella psychromarinicola]RPA34173.1 efflux RND transporter periplasmic adaptor subunit [Shewanella psychromarinicola]